MKIINELFENSNSNIIKSVINSGGVIVGEKMEGKRGYFTENMERSNRIAEKVESETGLKGFITTDELPKYGITVEDRDNIKQEFNCSDNDIVVMVAGKEEDANKAVELIKENVE
ncbi:MAG: GAD domain-containing protein [Elusimicrobiota bacterium]